MQGDTSGNPEGRLQF